MATEPEPDAVLVEQVASMLSSRVVAGRDARPFQGFWLMRAREFVNDWQAAGGVLLRRADVIRLRDLLSETLYGHRDRVGVEHDCALQRSLRSALDELRAA